MSKHLDIFLDAKLILPRPVLMTIYKVFLRPHLDYGDVIYVEVHNETFHQKLDLFNIISAYSYRELLKDSQEKNLPRISLGIS